MDKQKKSIVENCGSMNDICLITDEKDPEKILEKYPKANIIKVSNIKRDGEYYKKLKQEVEQNIEFIRGYFMNFKYDEEVLRNGPNKNQLKKKTIKLMEEHLIEYPINEGKNGIFKASGQGKCISNVIINKCSNSGLQHLNVCFGVVFASEQNLDLDGSITKIIKSLKFKQVLDNFKIEEKKEISESIHCWLEDDDGNIYDAYQLDDRYRFEALSAEFLAKNNLYYIKYNEIVSNLLTIKFSREFFTPISKNSS